MTFCTLSSAIFITSPEIQQVALYPLTETQDGGRSGELCLSTEHLTVTTSEKRSTYWNGLWLDFDLVELLITHVRKNIRGLCQVTHISYQKAVPPTHQRETTVSHFLLL